MGILVILIILSFYGFAYHYKKNLLPRIKGARGEDEVSKKLNRLNKRAYIVLNDILLKFGDSSTQIDHVVICQSGIFVIETKNYKGWIHGHQNSEYWTKTIYRYKKKLRNPIKQNWVHVYALKDILAEFGFIEYFPVVVFAGVGKLMNVTSDLPVIKTKKLRKTIKKLNRTEYLSYDIMQEIADTILELNITDRKETKKHIKRVKRQVRVKKADEGGRTCPNCGGKLIIRGGKYGRFYGCLSFPKCRYTLKY
ncbi:NERD domain-containing protein [Aestuariibaculum suncheonense]|uniref:NERD domain-containing protein n=1 Tax=Aestuariibaculum suncheonense TaxID=1028745 RepID=A0A8J6Q9X6_9FLAO|nr:NERD domain-containing protein [Aestuariibaculum suncheonense]MBD0835840.1 NERD domain-containing protein [Aestuariibaculum suncheonense]